MAMERLPGAVVLDLNLPALYGTSVAVALRTQYRELAFILVSGVPEEVLAAEAEQIGAFAYFSKPFDCEALVRSVCAALGRR